MDTYRYFASYFIMFMTYGAVSVYSKILPFTTAGRICNIVSNVGTILIWAVIVSTFFLFPWWSAILALILSWFFGNYLGGKTVSWGIPGPYLSAVIFCIATAYIAIRIINH